MPTTVTVPTTWYSLPREGAEAQADFLALLALPVETYVMAFTLTLAPAVSALEALAAAGVPVHVLLDRSQALMAYETPKVRAFMQAMPAGSVVLTTAGPDSPRPSVIEHRKSLCKMTTPLPTLWKGSANFTAEGFDEGNECSCCQSAEMAAEFISDFELRTWALAHVDQTLPAGPVTLASMPPGAYWYTFDPFGYRLWQGDAPTYEGGLSWSSLSQPWTLFGPIPGLEFPGLGDRAILQVEIIAKGPVTT
jgi:hypothetical protein